MIQVTVCCALAARVVFEEDLTLPDGCTVRQAIAASSLEAHYPALDWSMLQPGIWGRATDWDRVLAAGDRVELCRPLAVDPKVARRERFQQQGRRAAGLFTRRRQGGKAGY